MRSWYAKAIHWPPFFILWILLLPPSGLGGQWPAIDGPCGLQFPKDHGSHDFHRTEWWYYTGNLSSTNGNHYGFQLTFFRSRISPPGSESTWPSPPSAWRTSHIMLAHAAVSDLTHQRFFHSESTARRVGQIAGIRQNQDQMELFIRNWTIRIAPNGHELKAITNDFDFHLRTLAEKPPVLHGNQGYSRKGQHPESASCYYSMTRLATEGRLRVQGISHQVSGLAWMDHEFSSAPLEPNLAGWDWFSLQFNDQTELMVYLMRSKTGQFSPASGGTLVEADGHPVRIGFKDLRPVPLKYWQSPHTRAKYPVKWRLSIAPIAMELVVTARMNGQEMQSPTSTGVTYWEGSVSVTGTRQHRKVTGIGYMELTGYDKAFDAPM